MFPQTPHIECVALLERGRLSDAARLRSRRPGLDPEVASPLAARCQELGYASMWSNDHPGANGLETLAEFARGADRIDLGVTMLALDRHDPETIAADLERTRPGPRAALARRSAPASPKKPLTTMREALPALREALPGVRLVLAAMGPKMCALAGAEWDGAFFNWVTPEFAEGAASTSRRGPARPAGSRLRCWATSAPRSAPTPSSASPRRSRFYRDLHKGYRDHFDRLGEPEGTVGVAAENAGEAQAELSRYRALDTVVVRASPAPRSRT